MLKFFRARRTRAAFLVALALAAIPLCWAIWESVPTFAAPARAESAPTLADAVAASGPTSPPVAPAPEPTGSRSPGEVRDLPPIVRERDAPLRAFTMDANLRALAISTASLIDPTVPVPAADPDPLWQSAALISELFEMGDARAKVLAVEGSPDNAGDTVYRYGSSLVYFREGRVRGWVNRLPRLRVRSSESIDSPSIERFSLGSSRGEVIRAQGAPGAFTTDTYLFGSSAVYFDRGQVTGWREGGVPLRALDVPQLPFRGPEPSRRP